MYYSHRSRYSDNANTISLSLALVHRCDPWLFISFPDLHHGITIQAASLTFGIFWFLRQSQIIFSACAVAWDLDKPRSDLVASGAHDCSWAPFEIEHRLEPKRTWWRATSQTLPQETEWGMVSATRKHEPGVGAWIWESLSFALGLECCVWKTVSGPTA